MKKMMQTGLGVVLAMLFMTSSWAEVKSVAKPTAHPVHPSDPVVDTVFHHPAATGVIPCEDGIKVTISKDVQRADGFDVVIGKARYPTTRVATDSGAIRLENKASGIVWLQMSNKSMLFNEKAGKRLANNCRNEAQVAAEHVLSTSTALTVLDTLTAQKP